jgi:hypothetical protein
MEIREEKLDFQEIYASVNDLFMATVKEKDLKLECSFHQKHCANKE